MSDFETRAREAAAAVRQQIAALPDRHEQGIRRAQQPPARVAGRVAVAAAVLIGAVAIGVPVLRTGVTTGAESTSGGGAAAGGAAPAGGGGAAFALTGALKPFPTCDSALQYFHEHGSDDLIDRVGGGAVGGGPFRRVPMAQSDSAASAGAGEAASAPEHSETNIQETGVDEPDIVKTDGSTIFSLQGNTVRAVDVTDAAPRLAGSLALPSNESASSLLLDGNRLIVIGQSYPRPVGLRVGGGAGSRVAVAPGALVLPVGFWQAQTVLTEVDVTDPAKMAITRTMTVDGSFVDARQNGSSARFVIESTPAALAYPAQARAARSWVPARRFHSLVTRRRYTVPVAHCNEIRRPAQFSGLGIVTILTVDLGKGLFATDSTAIMANPQIVYGSATSLYLATERWIDPATPYSVVPQSDDTVIDRFDLSDPAKATYAGSGEVPGYVLNQYSLSEFGGDLRVASTSRPIWWAGMQPTADSQSYVTELRIDASGLSEVGQISGLGQGQQIYSVRFVQDAGYVVTFRRVDPLYTLALSDPSAPRVVGKLELEGYSSYLHPLADGLLLGVGNDVGATNEPSGGMLELFDVSIPAAPRLLAKASLGAGSSTPVQYDHHAFLYWPATGLAMLPVEIDQPVVVGPPLPPAAPAQTVAGPCCTGSTTTTGQPFVGAIGFTISPAGIAELGRISHDPIDGYTPQIERAVVVGTHLYSLSQAGLMASDLATLARQSFVAFPQPPAPVLTCGAVGVAPGGRAGGASAVAIVPCAS
jgi:hypothetical protein